MGKIDADAAAPVNAAPDALELLPVTMLVEAAPALFTGPRERLDVDVPPAQHRPPIRTRRCVRRDRADPAGSLESRKQFENDVILIQLREDRGYLALPIRVIECLIDRRGGNPEAGSGIAIVHQCRAQALIQLVSGDIAQLSQLPQLCQHAWSVDVQFLQVRVFQRVLKLGSADTIFHREILNRLHCRV